MQLSILGKSECFKHALVISFWAILTVGRLVRTTKTVVEEKVLEAWMVHHAAQVICACMVGADGLTQFRRLKGRKFGTFR